MASFCSKCPGAPGIWQGDLAVIIHVVITSDAKKNWGISSANSLFPNSVSPGPGGPEPTEGTIEPALWQDRAGPRGQIPPGMHSLLKLAKSLQALG